MKTTTNFRAWYLLMAIPLLALLSLLDTGNFTQAKAMAKVVQAQTGVPPCPEDGNCPVGDNRTWGEFWENMKDKYFGKKKSTFDPGETGSGTIDDNERPYVQRCDEKDSDTKANGSIGPNGISGGFEQNERYMYERCIRHCWSGKESCWASKCGNIGEKC